MPSGLSCSSDTARREQPLPPPVSAGCDSEDLVAGTHLFRHLERNVGARSGPFYFLVLDLERFDGFGEVGRVPFHTNAVPHCQLTSQRRRGDADVREVVGDLADRLFRHTKISSGSTADTTKLGTSTTSLIFRSTATEQIAYACWRE